MSHSSRTGSFVCVWAERGDLSDPGSAAAFGCISSNCRHQHGVCLVLILKAAVALGLSGNPPHTGRSLNARRVVSGQLLKWVKRCCEEGGALEIPCCVSGSPSCSSEWLRAVWHWLRSPRRASPASAAALQWQQPCRQCTPQLLSQKQVAVAQSLCGLLREEGKGFLVLRLSWKDDANTTGFHSWKYSC